MNAALKLGNPRRLRVLILTHHYPPEVGAPQTRLSETAAFLRARGHQVRVLTAMPSYPHGEIPEPYRGRWLVRERVAGVPVLRTWTYARPGGSVRQRLANQLSFAVSSLIGVGFAARHDVLLVESPPLFLGASGALLGRLAGARVVLHVADLWPDVAADLGALSGGWASRLAHVFERAVYAASNLVIVVTREWAAEIGRRGVDPSRLAVVTNGVDEQLLDPSTQAAERRRLRTALSLEGKVVVACVGTVGNVYDYNLILDAAERLAGHRELAFLIVGSGSREAWMHQEISRRGLQNVTILPAQPRDRIPTVLASADISVVALRPLPVTRGILPVRLLEAMAMALPVVAATAGESRRVLEDGQCGVGVDPGDLDGFAGAIATLADDAGLRAAMGHGGRAEIQRAYSRRHVGQRLEAELLAAAGR
ncbi:MAG: glycosyltransferase family 4 protein [Chloroflexota bacterium]